MSVNYHRSCFLDLCCEKCKESGNYLGETLQDCCSQAESEGWSIYWDRGGQPTGSFCYKCTKQVKPVKCE